jgi:two-component system, CitB family, response regulator
MQQLSILIVEDDPMVLFINQRYLSKMAMTTDIQEATTIQEALTQLENRHFDLILLDVELKNGNGLDLAKKNS